MVAHQEQILLVEDEEDIAFVLKARLEAIGYGVHAETYGSTALSYAAEHRPDLVILDLGLPDLGGDKVCEELRKLYDRSDVRVLMFTSLDLPYDEQQNVSKQADAYLEKRCEPAKLLSTIEQLLEEEPVAA